MPFDAEKLVGLRRVSSAVPSPDGTWLAVSAQRLDKKTSSKYVSDIWRVPLGGGDPINLTHSEWNDHSPAFLSDGSLAFLSNRPTHIDDDTGHESRNQVFAFRPWGGDAECMTDEPLGISSFKAATQAMTLVCLAPVLRDVAHDEQREYVKNRQENGPTSLVYDSMPVRFWDHWLPEQVPHLIAYDDEGRRDLTPDVHRELLRADYAVSPDGIRVALCPASPGSDRLYEMWIELVDTRTAERNLLRPTDRSWWGSPVFSNDGHKLAVTYHQRKTGAYGESELRVIDLENDTERTLGTEFDSWLTPQAWTADGRVIATAPWKTHAPVFAVDATDGRVSRITSDVAGGSHSSISVASTGQIIGVRSSIVQPPAPFIIEDSPDSMPEIVVDISGLDELNLNVESCEIESTDGTMVQYFVVRRGDEDGRLPALMWIHGGPISDWGDIWHWRWNSAIPADEEFAVILPNPRGSTGFGQEFVEGIWNNEWGAQCYDDLMAVTDAVAARPDIAEDRMVAMGGSFGGYMTNWIGTQTDRFNCLVTHAGLFDLSAFHGVTDLPAWWAHSFGVHPYQEREAFHQYSPVAHIDGWVSPTLIIHGEKDYRVPVGEALALFEALQFKGVDSRLLIFPDENHWILRPRNIQTWYGAVLEFIQAHLG